MGTINKEIAKQVIDGMYLEDNPTKIVTYENMFDGSLTFAVVFGHDNQQKYENSHACTDVRTVWTLHEGMTKYGEALFAGMDIDS